jgi:hypothetical protein
VGRPGQESPVRLSSAPALEHNQADPAVYQ